MAHLQEKAEWSCVLGELMVQCVMTSGTVWMPGLSADNWDSMTLVRKTFINSFLIQITLHFSYCMNVLHIGFVIQKILCRATSSIECFNRLIEAVAVKRAYFGSFEFHPIHLDNVQCTGSEENITQCSYITSTAINCDHSEDAGVICGGAYMSLCVNFQHEQCV